MASLGSRSFCRRLRQLWNLRRELQITLAMMLDRSARSTRAPALTDNQPTTSFLFYSCFSKNHTAFRSISLWHVGYLFDDFHGLYMCSRVGLLQYSHARHPAFTKAPRLLGKWIPSYWFSRVVATTDRHPLLSRSFQYLTSRILSSPMSWTPPLLKTCSVLSMLAGSSECPRRGWASPRADCSLLCACP